MNQAFLIGRLVRDPEIRNTETGKKISTVTLAVPRSYKNSEGQYETDFINCVLWTGIAETTCEYCHKGDLIGVKGRIQVRAINNEDETPKKIVEVVAEKVSFLSTKKTDE